MRDLTNENWMVDSGKAENNMNYDWEPHFRKPSYIVGYLTVIYDERLDTHGLDTPGSVAKLHVKFKTDHGSSILLVICDIAEKTPRRWLVNIGKSLLIGKYVYIYIYIIYMYIYIILCIWTKITIVNR